MSGSIKLTFRTRHICFLLKTSVPYRVFSRLANDSLSVNHNVLPNGWFIRPIHTCVEYIPFTSPIQFPFQRTWNCLLPWLTDPHQKMLVCHQSLCLKIFCDQIPNAIRAIFQQYQKTVSGVLASLNAANSS